jgi:hypothetical protein
MPQKQVTPLRNAEDLVEANEWLFNRQREGKIDAKSADGLNTTLKNSFNLLVKVPMDLLKLTIQARIKKVEIDIPRYLPGQVKSGND